MLCEGKVTEPAYFRGFQRWVGNAAAEVRILDRQGDPKYLVEIAKGRSRAAAEEAHREKDSFLAYDETWCVFDRDDHTRFHDACRMARDNGIEVAASNPCFELWLLLHHRDNPGAHQRHRLVKLLKTHIPGYGKHLDFELSETRAAQHRLEGVLAVLAIPCDSCPTLWKNFNPRAFLLLAGCPKARVSALYPHFVSWHHPCSSLWHSSRGAPLDAEGGFRSEHPPPSRRQGLDR